MFFTILEDNGLDFKEKLALLVILPLVVLLSLSLHEFSHALVSYALGDPTAKRMGRLTLDPRKHLSLVGTLCMFFCGFGWAKPVPIDPRYYKDPKKGMALTGLAGPASNLLIGLSALVAYTAYAFAYEHGLIASLPLLGSMPWLVYVVVPYLLFIVYYYNLLLAVFNLTPIPPLDGSRLLFAFLPAKTYFGIMKYEKLIMIAFFLLLWTGRFSFIFSGLVEGVEYVVYNGVYGVLESLWKMLTGLAATPAA